MFLGGVYPGWRLRWPTNVLLATGLTDTQRELSTEGSCPLPQTQAVKRNALPRTVACSP